MTTNLVVVATRPTEKTICLAVLLHTTGITATAGIGTNLYLTKIANDFKQIT